MNGLVKFVIFAILGIGGGYLSAIHMAAGGPFSGARQAGAWIVWPDSGAGSGSPYARLHYILQGQAPPSHFDRLDFEAQSDDAGRAIDPACSYVLEGPMPKIRWWALSAYGQERADGQTAVTEISSHDVIYSHDGRLRITLAAMAQPGNWLAMPGRGRITLVLHLFNAGPQARDALLEAPLRIRREGCS